MIRLDVEVRRKTFPGDGGKPGCMALEDVRFAVPAGQFVALAGPSGCGKSTLLNILAGVEAGFDGSVAVAGQPPGAAPAPGVMFQSPRLMPWMSALENVALVGDSPSRAHARALLQAVGLGEMLDTWPNRLSGGMQRRVAFARALVNRPSWILLDEPFLSLDPLCAAQLRETLLRYWGESGATVLLVTHDLREAISLADRLLVMTRSPGCVDADVAIDLKRPRDIDGPEVETMRQSLAGVSATNEEAGDKPDGVHHGHG